MSNLLNLSKAESDNLLNLRKDTLKLCLEKTKLLDTVARVAVVLDYSGSMRRLYNDGTVQAVIERLLPIAMQFDDNGEMEIWLFSDSFRRLPNISLKNYYGYVRDNIMNKGYRMGSTNYAPVMKDVAKKYMEEDPASLADYVIFITDGENFDEDESVSVITRNSHYPIFWQFVGIGNASFHFLRTLDEMDGRYVDNANFFAINSMLDAPDNEIYNKLLAEFPSWLEDPKVVDMISKQKSGSSGSGSKKGGFFSKLFG